VVAKLCIPDSLTVFDTNNERQIKESALNRLLPLQMKLNMIQMKAQMELSCFCSQINLTLNRSEIKEQQQILLDLGKADEKALEQALADKNPMVRLTAIQVISQQRLHLERDLIERLLDPQPLIRTAARQALIRLSRGVDFGPKAGAPKLEHLQAVYRWRNWLALQQSESSGKTQLQNPVQADADAQADRLVVELVQAKKDRETELLDSLRTGPEPQGTMVLAAAIRELKTPRQAKVRQTLALRLADQEVSQLKKRFTDEDVEVRRAALAAAGLKKDKALIPDALKLLEDPELAVAQEARATLKLLTGRDFGPAANASPLDRSIAIGQWYGWWLKQKNGE
jgi:HEAT repeat protein